LTKEHSTYIQKVEEFLSISRQFLLWITLVALHALVNLISHNIKIN